MSSRNWFPLGIVSVHFASMLSAKLSRHCNVVLAVLGEETDVPDQFVGSLIASMTNTDTCSPKAWNDEYADLSSRVHVDVRLLSMLMRIQRKMKAIRNHKQKTKPQPGKNQNVPPPRLWTPLAPHNASLASSFGSRVQSRKGLNTFVNHFSPSQGCNTQ